MALSFLCVDSNHIPLPFPFPQTISSSQLGDVVVPPNTEKLCLLKDGKKSVKVFSAIHVCAHGLAASPMGIVPLLPSQEDRSFSVRARMDSPFTRCFHFLLFISSSRQTTFTTTSFLCERVQFDNLVNQDDLLVLNVVLYPLRLQNTTVLSSSYSSSRVLIPCCSRKQPNEGEWEEVIVVGLPELFREMKLLSDSHPCFYTRYR